MTNIAVQVSIPNRAFWMRNPAQIGEKLGGHQLPLEHFERLEFPAEGGMLSWYKIFVFPTKGVPVGQALELIGVVKKLMLGAMRILISAPFRYFLPVFFLLPKAIQKRALYKVLRIFIEVSDQAFDLWYLEPKFMSTMCRELYFKTDVWIRKNFSEKKIEGGAWETAFTERQIWERMLLILCSVFEYDSAYRYRLQDILSELDMAAFSKSPAQEIERLFQILLRRERTGGLFSEKYLPFITTLTYAFWFFPEIKKGMVEILSSMDVTGLTWKEFRAYCEMKEFPDLPSQGKEQRIGRDHADWYHCLGNPGYDHGGIPFPERLQTKKKITLLWVEKQQRGGNVRL